MARKSTSTGTMIDRFRYAPGDGHVYVWPAGDDTEAIRVYRIKSPDPLIVTDTGDRIDIKDVARTATAMAARVDRWWIARQSVTTP